MVGTVGSQVQALYVFLTFFCIYIYIFVCREGDIFDLAFGSAKLPIFHTICKYIRVYTNKLHR